MTKLNRIFATAALAAGLFVSLGLGTAQAEDIRNYDGSDGITEGFDVHSHIPDNSNPTGSGEGSSPDCVSNCGTNVVGG